ncbi:MAG: hypothetical protein C4290_06830, partial [Chloroflexota bacterium]
MLGALLLAACGQTVTTEVLTVVRPLSEPEELRYQVLNDKGEQIGTALLTVMPEGEVLRLGLTYDFGPERKDTATVVVRRESMKPVRSERVVVDGARRYVTRAEYGPDAVVVMLDDGGRGRRSEAAIGASAYDNLASLFLWRTLEQGVGASVRFGNVIVDPRRGTISRAVATVETIGRGNVDLPGGAEQAWRVEFRAAGVTNTA